MRIGSSWILQCHKSKGMSQEIKHFQVHKNRLVHTLLRHNWDTPTLDLSPVLHMRQVQTRKRRKHGAPRFPEFGPENGYSGGLKKQLVNWTSECSATVGRPSRRHSCLRGATLVPVEMVMAQKMQRIKPSDSFNTFHLNQP